MSNEFLPNVGDYGLFTFIDNLTIPSNQGYKVEAMARFNEFLSYEVNLAAAYDSIGLTGYAEDMANNVIVMRLVSVQGTYYLPVRAVTSFPSVDTYEYRQRILGIDLGILPSDEGLDSAIARIKNAIRQELGISVQVRVAAQGTSLWLMRADHDAKLVQRDALKEVAPTLGAQVERLQDELNKERARTALLEELLLNQPA